MKRFIGDYSRGVQKRVISEQFYLLPKRTRFNNYHTSAYNNGCSTSSSGMYGNKMYFSDEDELDGEEMWYNDYDNDEVL